MVAAVRGTYRALVAQIRRQNPYISIAYPLGKPLGVSPRSFLDSYDTYDTEVHFRQNPLISLKNPLIDIYPTGN